MTRSAALCRQARTRFERDEPSPLFLADWSHVLFVHLEIDPDALQPFVPHPLDLRDGRAYVSLVAFTQERLRFARGGRWTRWATWPIERHGFMNVRTYVSVGDETGICFLTEWLPNPLAVLAGPLLYGLPYRWGRLDYRWRPERVDNRVVVGGKALRVTADVSGDPEPAVDGTLDHFLCERYTAWTRGRRFRVWHEPWMLRSADVRLEETSLIDGLPYLRGARIAGAAASSGVTGVWIGAPI